MPDKNYKRGCEKSCIRCWRNKLKHAGGKSAAVNFQVYDPTRHVDIVCDQSIQVSRV